MISWCLSTTYSLFQHPFIHPSILYYCCSNNRFHSIQFAIQWKLSFYRQPIPIHFSFSDSFNSQWLHAMFWCHSFCCWMNEKLSFFTSLLFLLFPFCSIVGLPFQFVIRRLLLSIDFWHTFFAFKWEKFCLFLARDVAFF